MCWFKNRVTKPTPCQPFLLHMYMIYTQLHICITYMHHICISIGPEIFAVDSSHSYMFLSPIQTVTKILQQTPAQRNQTLILHGETLLMLYQYISLHFNGSSQKHIHTQTYKHTLTHTNIQTHTHTNVQTHTHTHKHIHTHTYTSTHTSMHTQTSTHHKHAYIINKERCIP